MILCNITLILVFIFSNIVEKYAGVHVQITLLIYGTFKMNYLEICNEVECANKMHKCGLPITLKISLIV